MKMRLLACAVLLAALCAAGGCARKPAQAASTEAGSAGGGGSAAGGAAARGVGGGGPSAPAPKDIEAFGTVKAKTVRTISLDFPAVMEKKIVSEGERVKAGQILFRISTADYEAQLSAKSLELQTARFDLSKAEQERQKLEEDLKTARTDLARADKDATAKKDLLAMGAVSQDEADAADKTLSASRQRVRELERQITQYAAVGVNGLDIQKARIANQERELERLRSQSRRSYISGSAIVADVPDGVVSEIGCAEGDALQPGRKLCSLQDLSSIMVEANISEEFIKDIHVGSPADIVPLADSSRTYKGKVTRISGLAVRVNGETVIQVEIAFDKPDDFLRPNFNVDVKIY